MFMKLNVPAQLVSVRSLEVGLTIPDVLVIEIALVGRFGGGSEWCG